jgi:hypothetical protein
VLWAPVLAALGVIALAPSRRQLQQREAEAVARAEERVRLELLAREPVTPTESGQWCAAGLPGFDGKRAASALAFRGSTQGGSGGAAPTARVANRRTYKQQPPRRLRLHPAG